VLHWSAMLALADTAAAQSRVGVTSATDGDPLGKPPTTAERVLKIGIDVQANEVVTTHANDRAHLVFVDGSSLTVGPNARLTIDKFVYDPNSKTNPITITTPSGTIGIRGSITIFNVSQGRTTANFIFGNNMTVTNQGQSQNVTRPGSQVIVNSNAPPSPPSLLPPGGLTALVGQLEGGGGSTSGSGRDGFRRQRRKRRLEGAEFRPLQQQLRQHQFGTADKSAGHWRWPAQRQ
jgi:hypothetical protein